MHFNFGYNYLGQYIIVTNPVHGFPSNCHQRSPLHHIDPHTTQTVTRHSGRIPYHPLHWLHTAVTNHIHTIAAFMPCRNYRNSEMTTRDVQLCAVHILGLGIIHFYSDSQQMNPRLHERMLLAAVKQINYICMLLDIAEHRKRVR